MSFLYMFVCPSQDSVPCDAMWHEQSRHVWMVSKIKNLKQSDLPSYMVSLSGTKSNPPFGLQAGFGIKVDLQIPNVANGSLIAL